MGFHSFAVYHFSHRGDLPSQKTALHDFSPHLCWFSFFMRAICFLSYVFLFPPRPFYPPRKVANLAWTWSQLELWHLSARRWYSSWGYQSGQSCTTDAHFQFLVVPSKRPRSLQFSMFSLWFLIAMIPIFQSVYFAFFIFWLLLDEVDDKSVNQ